MKKWLKQVFRRPLDGIKSAQSSGDEANAEEIAGSVQSACETHHAYSPDLPISSKNEDQFNRWVFAKRIADTLAEREDSSSIVIGLYGPWGDGKTSTLRLMEQALMESGHVVVIRFNPWHFQSEEQLLRGFFATVAQAVGKSLPTMKENIGKVIKDYGSLLSLASISVGGAIQISPGEAAKGVGEALSTVELDDLRTRIETLLEKGGKRIVVLIDDIDRLDRAETQAIFKLVKLSASFNYTSYVLAFDDAIVAAAIGEKYGQGGFEAGQAFIEKIIQVPLHLPPPPEIALRQLTFDGVNAALMQSEIVLTQEQIDAFARHFIDGLEPQLQTPRHAKLYTNALMFSLPLLKDEVHPVDLMLIEGIRIFYPKLYKVIRDNPEYFLQSSRNANRQDEQRQKISAIIENALDGIGVQDKGRVRTRLLEVLFPRLSSMGYGNEWDGQWEREQRICSNEYFRRYFTYSVPPGDVSDIEVAQFLEEITKMEPANMDEKFNMFAERRAIPQLVRKFRVREGEVNAKAATALALAIARNGTLVPRERAMLMSDWTFMQAAILVAHLLKRVPPGEIRETLACAICRTAEPICFGFECFRWIRYDEKEPEEKRILPPDGEKNISEILAVRIRELAEKIPLYKTFGRDTYVLYWFWSEQEGENSVSTHLRNCFEENPNEVDDFLDTFVGEAWGVESGLPHRSIFRREDYDAVAKLIEPEFIMSNLKQRYGEEIGSPEFYRGAEIPLSHRIAHQFAYIHAKADEENGQSASNEPE